MMGASADASFELTKNRRGGSTPVWPGSRPNQTGGRPWVSSTIFPSTPPTMRCRAVPTSANSSSPDARTATDRCISPKHTSPDCRSTSACPIAITSDAAPKSSSPAASPPSPIADTSECRAWW